MTDSAKKYLTADEAEEQFSAAMADHDFGDHHCPADGQWHNFAFPDNSPGHASGSMKLTFSENPEGVVKDFRNGDDGKLLLIWRPEGDTIVDFTQVSEARKKQAAADTERREQQERVRSESQRLFESLPEATKDHPYLKSHGITHPVPLRVEGDVLVVPIYKAATGTFQAIQRIWPNGDKGPAGATKTGGCAMPWSSFELNGLKTHSKDDSPIVMRDRHRCRHQGCDQIPNARCPRLRKPEGSSPGDT